MLCVLTAASAAVSSTATREPSLRMLVASAPDRGHFAWQAAQRLARAVEETGIATEVAPAPLDEAKARRWDLIILPVRSLAPRIPELQILELPFLYPGIEAVHFNLDGQLGPHLARRAQRRGWRILGFWDEGMHVFSGLKRFDRVRNLKAREFLITRPDPVAEKQFTYWKADTRRIDPRDRETVLRECLIASRAATLQRIHDEQLYRVHFTVSRSNHRYEGWIVAAPLERWEALEKTTQNALTAAVAELKTWQRKDAAQREAQSLAALKRHGMQVVDVDKKERRGFQAALPTLTQLLPEELSEAEKLELYELTLAGTTAFVTASQAPANPPAREVSVPSPNHQSH